MVHEQVKAYYGQVLQGSEDLQTDACCTADSVPPALRPVLADIHPEVSGRYYGCGLVVPSELEGATVLDLGCGAGRDCFALSRLVGEHGRVVGVDMTPEQLAVACEHVDYHTRLYGYQAVNVEFHEGYIERLDELDLPAGGFDLIVSNCVLNLSPDKEAVLREAWRLLRPGGEMYFSDVYADRRVPSHLVSDPRLHGECLSGALYWNDFLAIAARAGFADPRLVTDRPLGINSDDVRARLGPIRFFSATWRLFRIEGLEPACEDYGQAVEYRGSVAGEPEAFTLDKHHVMPRGKVFPVCGNTWRMLAETRFASHFTFHGEGSIHYGLFGGCGQAMPFGDAGAACDSESGFC